MTASTIIRHSLDALLHPSARRDALACARHRAFIGLRLIGSLGALCVLPIYLVMRGEPSALEIAGFAWLIAPLLIVAFLSRTGRLEAAHLMSSVALAALVMMVAYHTGGVSSFAAAWLILLPFEAALSASRRVVAAAALLAIGCALTLAALGVAGALPPAHGIGVAPFLLALLAALLYGASLACAGETLSRLAGALRSSEESRYRLLARHISDVISRHGASGAVTFISPAAEALLGAPTATLAGHGLFERVHVADRPAYLTALSRAARDRAAASAEFRIRRDGHGAAHGGFVWVEMRCRPLDDATGEAGEVVAVMRDITERKRHDEAIEAARAAAARAEESHGRFLAAMSHELRTPLNAIIGFSEMIAKEDALMIGAERRKEYAELIHGSGQHLLSVVNSILDMSKMESGAFEIVPEAFAPRPAIVQCCDLLALKARDNGVELTTRAPETLPTMIGDPRAFRQILLNLVSNAVKFTDRGGVVTVAAAAQSGSLVITVEDSGIGIAADDLARLGDPFFQAGPTYRRRHEGTGLGLSIVKSLVALHGGTMRIESRLGEGTRVTVTLPLEVAAPPPRATVTPLPPPKAAQTTSEEPRARKSA